MREKRSKKGKRRRGEHNRAHIHTYTTSIQSIHTRTYIMEDTKLKVRQDSIIDYESASDDDDVTLRGEEDTKEGKEEDAAKRYVKRNTTEGTRRSHISLK